MTIFLNHLEKIDYCLKNCFLPLSPKLSIFWGKGRYFQITFYFFHQWIEIIWNHIVIIIVIIFLVAIITILPSFLTYRYHKLAMAFSTSPPYVANTRAGISAPHVIWIFNIHRLATTWVSDVSINYQLTPSFWRKK